MKTHTYNSANLSIKERLAISSLLTLFESRLNAKWVAVNPGQGPAPDVVLVDADQPEGRQAAFNPRETILPVTADDGWPPPFIARPIRAYGASGLIVLFNSLSQSLSSADHQGVDHQRVHNQGAEQRREPALFRMTGRLEAARRRSVRPGHPHLNRLHWPTTWSRRRCRRHPRLQYAWPYVGRHLSRSSFPLFFRCPARGFIGSAEPHNAPGLSISRL